MLLRLTTKDHGGKACKDPLPAIPKYDAAIKKRL
jgi:hypothetical protein